MLRLRVNEGKQSMLTFIALVAASATAAPSEEMQHMLVSYSDLDLSGPADIRLLNRRVRLAADNICRGADYKNDPRPRDMKGCRHGIIARSRPHITAAVARARPSQR